MRAITRIGLVAIPVLSCLLFGCSAPTDKPPTASEVKAFKGGPMPASARKEFEEGQRKSEEARAKLIENARAKTGAQ